MHPIIRLVNRNITISINPGFLIWQVIFPLIWIFVAGFAYTALIDEVSFGTKNLSYPAFLASGMIGFNIMNSTLISGIIIWNDRRHGMFEQIMSGPFTRSNYILSNITTIAIVGLVSATIFSHGDDGVTLKLASGKFITLNKKKQGDDRNLGRRWSY